MSLLLVPAVLIVAFVLPIAMARLEPEQDPLPGEEPPQRTRDER
ncbi:hypothetical protein [Nocardioides aestuarii]|uniref:Uncharacterized protein n=1 Tax=Nocardioides aestuarii TaxID=252231 RepID=A0ABW4TPW8_9ACTN